MITINCLFEYNELELAFESKQVLNLENILVDFGFSIIIDGNLLLLDPLVDSTNLSNNQVKHNYQHYYDIKKPAYPIYQNY